MMYTGTLFCGSARRKAGYDMVGSEVGLAHCRASPWLACVWLPQCVGGWRPRTSGLQTTRCQSGSQMRTCVDGIATAHHGNCEPAAPAIAHVPCESAILDPATWSS
eukprot:1553810-Rhodomonas_salina.1